MVANMNLSGKIDVVANIPLNGAFKLSNEKIKLTFYRIIQEQLNNILKYAKASKASVNVKELPNSFQLIITDNGIGFDSTKEFKGIGLRNMPSRAELHAGTMEIIAAPGQGCIIKIEIPFE